MNTYEDMLVTDIERIHRARDILNNPMSNRRERVEALQCIELYEELSNYYCSKGNEEQRYRAREIMYELYKRYER